jgi:hypothetical protein
MESPPPVVRVRNEFLEMPGLQLTLAQTARLLGLDTRDCREAIDALVASDFLRWTRRGTIARVS